MARIRWAFGAILLVALLGLLEVWGGYFTAYHMSDGTMVRSPSLLLDVKQLLGLQHFHSQLGQDKWLPGHVYPGVTDGYFVDVGAWDAVKHSNSKALETASWNGICADPFPVNWRDRRCQLFTEPVYSRAGEVVEFRTAGAVGGYVLEDLESLMS